MLVSCLPVFTLVLNISQCAYSSLAPGTDFELAYSHPEASRLCGKGVSSMTKLKSLDLCDMTFDDGFFLSESSSTSMVRTVSMLGVNFFVCYISSLITFYLHS